MPVREDPIPRVAENLLLGHTCDCCVNRSVPPVSKVFHCSARRERPRADTCIRFRLSKKKREV